MEKDFYHNILINDKVPYAVGLLHLELDDKGQPYDWTYIDCNEALARLNHTTKEKMLGRRFTEVFPGADKKWPKNYYATAYENKYHEYEEISHELDLYLHIEAIPTGEPGYLYCVLRNIRESVYERNRWANDLEAALEKERALSQRLQKTLDAAQLKDEIIEALGKCYCSIARVDIKNDFFEDIACEEGIFRLTGHSGSYTVASRRICDTMVSPEYRQYVREFLDISTLPQRLKQDDYISTEYQMCNGNWHRLGYVVKKRDADGNVTHVLSAVRSTTDEKMMEMNLLYAAGAAKREAELKTRFLANMSHDIRTPLNGIIGMLNLANQYPDNPEMLQKLRNNALESLHYLVALVNNILDMNKLQSGSLTSYDVTFDLIDMLQRVNQKYLTLAQEKGINYMVKWNHGQAVHPYLRGNPIYLERILSNIADNAIKFSAPGTTITVGLNEEQLDEERVLLSFFCQDQGVGMSEDFVKHAFDMFTQAADDSSRSTYQGSGLGLAIAHQLAQNMGGTIELQSQPGVGTTAITKVPFKIGSQEDNISIKSCREDMPLEGIRALVVEDNELNMEIAKMLLENNGIEVTCAVDGQEAVEIYEKSSPGYFGVIYMDLMMPRLNGLDATRAIRALPRLDAKSIGIIAMTANAFMDDIIACKLAGIDIHLAKPLDEKKMIEALRYCMSRNEDLQLLDPL